MIRQCCKKANQCRKACHASLAALGDVAKACWHSRFQGRDAGVWAFQAFGCTDGFLHRGWPDVTLVQAPPYRETQAKAWPLEPELSEPSSKPED